MKLEEIRLSLKKMSADAARLSAHLDWLSRRDVLQPLNKQKYRKDPAAQNLATKRWDATPEKARTKLAKKAANARWAGHVAKRPASARKKKAAE